MDSTAGSLALSFHWQCVMPAGSDLHVSSWAHQANNGKAGTLETLGKVCSPCFLGLLFLTVSPTLTVSHGLPVSIQVLTALRFLAVGANVFLHICIQSYRLHTQCHKIALTEWICLCEQKAFLFYKFTDHI